MFKWHRNHGASLRIVTNCAGVMIVNCNSTYRWGELIFWPAIAYPGIVRPLRMARHRLNEEAGIGNVINCYRLSEGGRWNKFDQLP